MLPPTTWLVETAGGRGFLIPMDAEGIIDAGKVAEVGGEKEIEGCCFPATVTTPPAAPDAVCAAAALVPEPRLPVCSGPAAAADTFLTNWAVPAIAVVFVQEEEGDAGKVAAGE